MSALLVKPVELDFSKPVRVYCNASETVCTRIEESDRAGDKVAVETYGAVIKDRQKISYLQAALFVLGTVFAILGVLSYSNLPALSVFSWFLVSLCIVSWIKNKNTFALLVPASVVTADAKEDIEQGKNSLAWASVLQEYSLYATASKLAPDHSALTWRDVVTEHEKIVDSRFAEIVEGLDDVSLTVQNFYDSDIKDQSSDESLGHTEGE